MPGPLPPARIATNLRETASAFPSSAKRGHVDFKVVRNPDGSYSIVVDDETVRIYPEKSAPPPPENPQDPGKPKPGSPRIGPRARREVAGSPKIGPRVTAYILSPERMLEMQRIDRLPRLVTPASLRRAAGTVVTNRVRRRRDAVEFKLRPGQQYNLTQVVRSARAAGIRVRLLMPKKPDWLK